MLTLFSRFPACSRTPAFEVWNATFELYPNSIMRARGNRFGRNSLSLNQSFLDSLEVHVCLAWNSLFVGFRPCIAMILFKKWGWLEKFDIISGITQYKRVLLDVGVFRINKDIKEIGQGRGLNVFNRVSRGSSIVTSSYWPFFVESLRVVT